MVLRVILLNCLLSMLIGTHQVSVQSLLPLDNLVGNLINVIRRRLVVVLLNLFELCLFLYFVIFSDYRQLPHDVWILFGPFEPLWLLF